VSERSGGFSKTRLGRMADVMRGYVDRGEIAGAVTLLCRHDEVHVEAIGARDLATAAPMRRDTIFRIASMTKPITAAAAMILVEEAKLRLDDPVDRWLPELANRKVLRGIDSPLHDTAPARRPITLRDLLTFRLGLGAVMVFPERYPIQKAMVEAGLAPGPRPLPFSPDEFMTRVGRLPLMHQPGEQWMYHTGSDILGVLIARAAGMSLGDFLKERILGPLGMEDTAFSVPEAKLDRLATCYQGDAATSRLAVFDEARGGLWARPPIFESGGGGLVSTADDYLAFGQMLLRYGRHGTDRILSRPAVEFMTTDQLTAEQKAASPFGQGFWETHGWGFGLSVITRRGGVGLSQGSFGWDGGFSTSGYCDPREDMVGILLVQRMMTSPSGFDFHSDFWTLAYQAIDD
jgi:CubicO group peptidase (beta-lactamase class C family)